MAPNQQSPQAKPEQQPEPAIDELKLPVLVFGVTEVRRLARELESLEDFLRTTEIRTPGTQPALPRLSRLLDGLAADNHLNLLQPADRTKLTAFLEHLEHEAPNIHMSFASDPSSNFTAKMVTWLRANIHPYALLQIGLQPTITAGCVVRTTNRVFDFSLRERFSKQEAGLLKALDLDAAQQGQTVVNTPPAADAAPAPIISAPVARPPQETPPAPVVPAQGAPAA